VPDLENAAVDAFRANGVLLDFTANRRDPHVRMLGDALRCECAITHEVATVADVPPRSLLSRLTDQYLQIIASRAPVGFEAEFVSQRGYNTLYRGILMPFSSDGVTIDYIYGVINWKELADYETASRLMIQVDHALTRQAKGGTGAALWADGPNAALRLGDDDDELPAAPAASGLAFVEAEDAPDDSALMDQLASARAMADDARLCEGRARVALHHALGMAHDLALDVATDAPALATLLARAGSQADTDAPAMVVARLVFGAQYDPGRLAEFAEVLTVAARRSVGAGMLPSFLEANGGLRKLVEESRS